MDKRSGRSTGPKKRVVQNGTDEAPKTEYKHKEAFCLMQYICERCFGSEILWNSRDGVTPFIIHCRMCGGAMKHENWKSDRYAPDHVPFPGQRIFIDMPESLKLPAIRWKFVLAKGTQFEIRPEQQKEATQELLKGFREHEPWIIEWPR